jgi:DNA mismatch repair protein MutH
MRVRVIVPHLPYIGPLDTEKEIPDAQAKVLIKLGKVEQIKSRPRRVYKRRDLQAETAAVAEVIGETAESEEAIDLRGPTE